MPPTALSSSSPKRANRGGVSLQIEQYYSHPASHGDTGNSQFDMAHIYFNNLQQEELQNVAVGPVD